MLLGLSHSGRRRPEETALTHPILVRSARAKRSTRVTPDSGNAVAPREVNDGSRRARTGLLRRRCSLGQARIALILAVNEEHGTRRVLRQWAALPLSAGDWMFVERYEVISYPMALSALGPAMKP
jgi:hypothetical protein